MAPPYTDNWDEALPDGDKDLALGDDDIRSNQRGLRQRLEQEHEVISGAQPLALNHKSGSARLSVGTLAARPVWANAFGTGRLHFVWDPGGPGPSHGRLYVCQDGATDTWEELIAFGEAVDFVGAVTVAGLLSADGGLTLPTGEVITVPPNEDFFTDGTTVLSPYLIAARLRELLTAGTRGEEYDDLAYLIQAITQNQTLLGGPAPITITPASGWTSLASISLDRTGRRNLGRAYVKARMTVDASLVGIPFQLAIGPTLDDPTGHYAGSLIEVVTLSNTVLLTHETSAIITGLTADPHILYLNIDNTGAFNFDVEDPIHIELWDLGNET